MPPVAAMINGIINRDTRLHQSGAKGLDGGYEAQVACRGSITTLKRWKQNTNANNELALAA